VIGAESFGGLLGGDVAVIDRLDRTALIFLDAAAFLTRRYGCAAAPALTSLTTSESV